MVKYQNTIVERRVYTRTTIGCNGLSFTGGNDLCV